MNEMDGQSRDNVRARIEELKKLFPEAVSERLLDYDNVLGTTRSDGIEILAVYIQRLGNLIQQFALGNPVIRFILSDTVVRSLLVKSVCLAPFLLSYSESCGYSLLISDCHNTPPPLKIIWRNGGAMDGLKMKTTAPFPPVGPGGGQPLLQKPTLSISEGRRRRQSPGKGFGRNAAANAEVQRPAISANYFHERPL